MTSAVAIVGGILVLTAVVFAVPAVVWITGRKDRADEGD
jgi:hypothetical protein